MFIGWFERVGYRRSDAIVSLMPAANEYINSISGDPSKFNWIPNGLDEECLNPEPASAQLLKQIPENKFIVGYTGGFNLADAMSFLISAAKMLKNNSNIHFVLVGEGYEKEELQRTARDINNITFLPKVKKSQVLDIIEKFNVCYIGWRNIPLYRYGVSANKYSDYMLCSKPILDSNNFVKDPVELSGCGLIVRPESAEAIAEGVIELYSMPSEKLEEMGKLGYKYVSENNNMRRLALKYETLFQ